MSRKMKDSGIEWIGEIPEEWRVSRIKEHFYQFRGSGLAKKDIDEKGALPCILYGELFTKYGNVITKIVSATNNAIEGFQAEVGDLILPATTTTSGADLARASLLMTPAKVGGDTHILRSKSTNICVSLLPYIFSASRDYFAHADKSVTVAHSSKGQIGNMSFVLGPLSEQQAIADYLDAKVGEIDANIARLESAIATLQSVADVHTSSTQFRLKALIAKLKLDSVPLRSMEEVSAKVALLQSQLALYTELRSALIYDAVTGKIEIPAEYYVGGKIEDKEIA